MFVYITEFSLGHLGKRGSIESIFACVSPPCGSGIRDEYGDGNTESHDSPEGDPGTLYMTTIIINTRTR